MKTTAKFGIVKKLVDKNVVSQLEVFVAMAQRGEIKNVIIIAEHRTSDPLFVQAGEYDPVRTLGILDWVKSRWRELEIVSWQSKDRVFGNIDLGTEGDEDEGE